MRTRLVAILLALAALGSSGASAATAPAQPPGRYLLGLGDSLAFGYQPIRNLLDASSFHTGFVDVLAVYLGTLRPGIEAVNYACPAETTVSFLAGGCRYNIFLPLHEDYPAERPQLGEALAFLAEHPGEVSPVVLAIGANDLHRLAGRCGWEAGCVAAGLPATLATVRANLETILAALRAAAPSATLVLIAYYNPYALSDLSTAEPVRALNALLAEAAAAHGAVLADLFPDFNERPPQPARLCALTFICGARDIHPTDDGHIVIAGRIFAAAGYQALAGARAGAQ